MIEKQSNEVNDKLSEEKIQFQTTSTFASISNYYEQPITCPMYQIDYPMAYTCWLHENPWPTYIPRYKKNGCFAAEFEMNQFGEDSQTKQCFLDLVVNFGFVNVNGKTIGFPYVDLAPLSPMMMVRFNKIRIMTYDAEQDVYYYSVPHANRWYLVSLWIAYDTQSSKIIVDWLDTSQTGVIISEGMHVEDMNRDGTIFMDDINAKPSTWRGSGIDISDDRYLFKRIPICMYRLVQYGQSGSLPNPLSGKVVAYPQLVQLAKGIQNVTFSKECFEEE